MGIDQLVNRDREQAETVVQGYRGKFAAAVPSIGALATVTIDSFDAGRQRFEGVRWMQREADLPNKGDTCLVLIDDQQEAWVPAWWPA